MWRFVLAVPLLIPLETQADAVGFEPDPAKVCLAGSASNGQRTFVSRRKLLNHLLEKELGLESGQLDSTGADVTYEKKAALVLNPEGKCKPDKCDKVAKDKLGTAQVIIIDFLSTHNDPIPEGQRGYRVISGHSGSDIELFLEGPERSVRIECIDRRIPESSSKQTTKKEPDPLPQYFAIRKKVEDLRFAPKSEQFKKLERASASFQNDFTNNTNSFGVEGVAGYTWGRGPIGAGIGQISIFSSYKQDYIRSPDPKKESRVFNAGGGVAADLLLPAFGMWHNLQFYPKYVQSLRTNEKLLSGNFVWAPEPAAAPFGQIYYLIPEVLSMQLTPQLKVIYGHVYNDGGDPTRLKTGNYFRAGPRLAAAFYGESLLAGFVFNASYEYYRDRQGPVDNIERLELGIDYLIGEEQLWALQLKYVKGRDLDTLNKQEQLTLGIGLKY